jgi:uncharacterized protein YaaQ
MKLIMSIINSEDARALIEELAKKDHRATMACTTDNTLHGENATIFVGVEDDQVDEVLSIIEDICHTRTQYLNPLPPVMEPGEMFVPSPVKEGTGGALTFVLNVENICTC